MPRPMVKANTSEVMTSTIGGMFMVKKGGKYADACEVGHKTGKNGIAICDEGGNGQHEAGSFADICNCRCNQADDYQWYKKLQEISENTVESSECPHRSEGKELSEDDAQDDGRDDAGQEPEFKLLQWVSVLYQYKFKFLYVKVKNFD